LAHVWPKVGDGLNGRWVGRIDCDELSGVAVEIELGVGDGQDEGAEVCIKVGGGVSEVSVGVADFVAGDIEDCYASGRLKVVGPVPVGLGAPGEDCEVVRSGGACFDSSDPAFPFFAMSDSVHQEKHTLIKCNN
jgi:hypothetical protein